MQDNTTVNMVLEDLVQYISKNGVQRSIKPVFKTDEFALYNEDCLKVMSRFPDNYVDMIFADPPYMLSNDGFTCHAGRMVSVNKGIGINQKDLKKIYYFTKRGLVNVKEY